MTTISARIQLSLASQIVSGELRPGHKLDEQALATQFGVSRTPIREALRELGARGLIDLVPHRGGIVAQIGLDKLSDMLDAECELEGLCARLASHRMTAVEKGELQACHAALRLLSGRDDENAYLAGNQTFHNLICAGARNDTLATMTGDLRTRLAPFRQSQGNTDRRFARSHEEHELIVDAILRADADAACDAMRRHNARLSTNILSRLRHGVAKVETKG